ncbi:MAG: DNA-directed RNA polymerase subunit omega [Denitrovibrio sp.]|nr:MAG: DNA-directed RNA polymerase subunit omega [Denitrovibrio sp.]
MPLLDIEKVIEKDKLNSRFKLVHIAGLRARELNSPTETTVSRQNEDHTKVTTTALSEVIEKQIAFEQNNVEEDAIEIAKANA